MYLVIKNNEILAGFRYMREAIDCSKRIPNSIVSETPKYIE